MAASSRRLVDWLARANGAQAFRFDPAIPQYDKQPAQKSDLVIVANVLEHIPEAAIDAALADIRALARERLFPNCHRLGLCHPAQRENAHCTIRSAEWWREKLRQLLQEGEGRGSEIE